MARAQKAPQPSRIAQATERALLSADRVASFVDVLFEAIKRGLIIAALGVAGRTLDSPPFVCAAYVLMFVLGVWVATKCAPYAHRWWKVAEQTDNAAFRRALDLAIMTVLALGVAVSASTLVVMASVDSAVIQAPEVAAGQRH